MSSKYTLKLVAVTTYFLLVTITSNGSVEGGVTERPSCVYRGEGQLKLPGMCKPINHCHSALSNLFAGVPTQPCNPEESRLTVCCPQAPRISEKKCAEYTRILKAPSGPVPMLPLDFLEERFEVSNDFVCPPLPSAFIVNGDDARPGQFPHMVALGYGEESEGKWLCGGTLISENFVLTAAHCVHDREHRPVQRVLLGSVELPSENEKHDDRRTVIDVEDRISHPNYKAPLHYNDIALLKLKKPVKFTKNLRPACLPQPDSRPERINETHVCGWGRIADAGPQSQTLRSISLTRIPQPSCEAIFNKPDKNFALPKGIIRSQFCAGDTQNRGRDSCSGDSGGPLTITKDGKNCLFYVTGVVSFGAVICGIEPAVYTNVQSYLDWIELHVWPGET